MKITAQINVGRFVEAMQSKQLNVVDACAICGVNNVTLAKIMRGEFPRRIDAFYRVVNGLGIPIKEALVAPAPPVPQKHQLYAINGRRDV
jgi:hypothetical protein